MHTEDDDTTRCNAGIGAVICAASFLTIIATFTALGICASFGG